MTPRWIPIVFGFIWLATAIVFGWLSFDAYESTHLRLSRFSVPSANGASFTMGGLNIEDIFRGLSDTNNANIDHLESSIHKSAHLAFVLNIVSCLAAVFGFIAQAGQYWHEQRKHTRRKRYARHHKSLSGVPDTNAPIRFS